MGIGFDHGKASWSYGGFNRFRERLAESIGIDLWSMRGFCGDGIPWDTVHDCIIPLLNHSDCEGELTPEECETVAPRLRELVKPWDEDYDKRNALDLADAMTQCSVDIKPLGFV